MLKFHNRIRNSSHCLNKSMGRHNNRFKGSRYKFFQSLSLISHSLNNLRDIINPNFPYILNSFQITTVFIRLLVFLVSLISSLSFLCILIICQWNITLLNRRFFHFLFILVQIFRIFHLLSK